ncbi:hypothetical protein, partial [Shewanella vesiculosa]|uniref:hypothetical protein n=1 Tax=Shewanella vesiculosa TaxID=518738 RepID=UPI001A9CE235
LLLAFPLLFLRSVSVRFFFFSSPIARSCYLALFFLLMLLPLRATHCISAAASDFYKRQTLEKGSFALGP